MANWRQLLRPPSGALPGNLVTKAGIGVIAVLLVGLVLSQSGGDSEVDEAGSAGEPGVSGRGVVGQISSRLSQLAEQRQMEEDDRNRRAAAAAGPTGGLPPALPASGLPTTDAGRDDMPLPPTAGEVELRERLRLEALERRARSLRAPSVVQTFRSPDTRAEGARLGDSDGSDPSSWPRAVADLTSEPAAASLPAPPDPAAIADQMHGANAALLAELANGDAADAAPPARTVPGVTGPPVGPTADPVVVTAPSDPAGWERVYEGSVLSAVLVTQLDGDFTGPVLAQVAIPFYSADRQRILVPRGARLLGAAQAVEQQDQGRLAVGFHRLVWPDGRWVDLAFHGLNGIGESALADQVDRHYASMFAAAGAVGVLAGLTLQGSDPYAGGGAGFRAAAGQGLGQSATQILSRFLNRLPTVTVRAGHRLRVWVTSDFLVPRPEPHPERMYRQ
ncbi:MAG: TrbI/VirB10 family protein [Acidobacteria bacterium]|nr:TrbI/VirB10 family protein [Acidobacteriota bacterium]